MARTVFSLLVAAVGLAGCKHASPSVTAVPLSAWNRDEPEGIPFYLPKPLLIVAKNFRNIEEAKVGLTTSAPIPNSFDDQAKYADLNARTNFVGLPAAAGPGTRDVSIPTGHAAFGSKDAASVSEPVLHSAGAPLSPGEAPADGLTPETFYTYQIVFVPDLTQKYGLRIKGGVGEIRAAMNLVNGWQFTGLGPYYMKDSSTAQNTLATGIAASLAASGVADVVAEVSGLAERLARRDVGPPSARTVTEAEVREVFQPLHGLAPVGRLEGYAEIHVFEPQLNLLDGTVCWVPVTELSFYREYLGLKSKETAARTHVLPDDAPAVPRAVPPLPAAPDAVSRGLRDGVPPGSLINMNQNCAPGVCPAPPPPEPKHPHWLKPLGWFGHHERGRPTIRTVVREQSFDAVGPALGDPGDVYAPGQTSNATGSGNGSDPTPVEP